jgi:PadR family transcriptional regulator PadR
MDRKAEVPQGTLDMMILKTLAIEPMHGYGIMQRLRQLTNGLFEATPGSMFPALQRMEEQGWIKGEWGASENNRRAKHYSITKAGRNQLEKKKEQWSAIVFAITTVLNANS